MLQRRRGAAVEMTVSVVEMMMMMIPMKSSSMTVTMATISPSGREFPRQISACWRALFSLVFSAPQRRLCLFSVVPRTLGFRVDELREREMAEGGRGPPPHKTARPGLGPRRPMGGPWRPSSAPPFGYLRLLEK